MAGIGFNLQKILEGDTLGSSLKAYFYSTLIIAGPWILSIFTIFVLSQFKPSNLDFLEILYFRTVLIYIFAFSLIIVGIFHFPLTRYLADKLFSKENQAIIPAFVTVSLCTLFVQSLLGGIYYLLSSADVLYKWLSIFIFLCIGLIWVLMIFLTALRDYNAIVVSYVVGSVVAILGSLFLGQWLGLSGYFLGYFLGHFIIVLLWTVRIFIEFQSVRNFDNEFFGFFLKNKKLILIGFFYNCAIWIDKIIIWFCSKDVIVVDIFRVNKIYDSAMFFAYLTIIPGLAIFLIQVETDFYMYYRKYYVGLLNEARLSSILKIKREMMANLRHSINMLLRYQGIISFIFIVYAVDIVQWVGLNPTQIPVLRVGILAAFIHCLLLLMVILILYFDFQKLALEVTGLFFILNAILTYITVYMDVAYLGYGYLSAALIALIFAFYRIDRKLNQLEYYTFALQPVGQHRETAI